MLPAVQQLGVPACQEHAARLPAFLGSSFTLPATEHLPTVQHIGCHQEEIRSRFGHSPHLSQTLKPSAWTLKMFTRALAAVVLEGCTTSSKATDVCQNAVTWLSWCTQNQTPAKFNAKDRRRDIRFRLQQQCSVRRDCFTTWAEYRSN